MRQISTTNVLRSRFISALLILAALISLFSQPHTTHADSLLPNVAVYELDPSNALHRQVSLHAPGTVTPAFIVPFGRYVTPNGHFAMAMSAPGAYEVFNLQTGTQVAGFPSSLGKSTPISMAVSPNGTYAAIMSISTIHSTDWQVVLYNLTANTSYFFIGTNSTTPLAKGTAVLQLAPTIVGWTGDESALILSTGVPFSDAPTHLFFKMPMAGIGFTAGGGTSSAIPPVTTLGTDQQITDLVFSPDSTRAAFLYEDQANMPVNYLPFSDGPGPGLPPNGIKVIALADGNAVSIAQAAAGQGLTAPAWAPDGHKLYYGAGPFQSTSYPVNVHLFNFDFSSITITHGDALIATDPGHVGVSDMQVCADQVFMREISIALSTPAIPSPSIVGKITSAPLASLSTHSDVYTALDNALGPCVPSIPVLGVTATSTITATPSGSIVCILAPQLKVGGMGIVTASAANNLRSMPTINSSLIGQIPVGQTFSVLGGPFCDTSSGYIYWQVSYNGITAYTSEGKTVYLVLPYTGAPPIHIITPTVTPIHIVVPKSLTAPVQISPANGTIYNTTVHSTTVQWIPVSGAASYTVVVQTCTSVSQTSCSSYVISKNVTNTFYPLTFNSTQPIRWAVYAVDANGTVGPQSGWWVFSFAYSK